MTILSRDASANVLASLRGGPILLSVEAIPKPHFRTILPKLPSKASTDQPTRFPLSTACLSRLDFDTPVPRRSMPSISSLWNYGATGVQSRIAIWFDLYSRAELDADLRAELDPDSRAELDFGLLGVRLLVARTV